MIPLQVVWTSFFVNIASPTSSHAADIDNSDLFIAGNVQSILALVRSEGMFNVPIYVAFMVL